MSDLRAMSKKAVDEIEGVLDALDPKTTDTLSSEMLNARRIACFGAGREGLMMKALCMRLMHLGFDAHFVGDVTTPPIGAGDLLIASSGTGIMATVQALLSVAKRDGARTLMITAQPKNDMAKYADVVIYLPVYLSANNGALTDALPAGSLFEIVELLLFDLVALILRDKTHQTSDDMRQRQTNLE